MFLLQINCSVIPGAIGLEAGQSAFGDVYAWFKKLLEYAGNISIADLEKDAMLIPPGAGGVCALDWFNGRRTPYSNNAVKGALLGLSLGTTAPMIYRSLVESTLFGARAIVEHFKQQGIPVNSITAAGGLKLKIYPPSSRSFSSRKASM